MSLRVLHVDAFADRAFAGNPAAVCLLPAPATAEWMQHVAAEMNLSETAFVAPRADDGAGPSFDLRWFTPTVEVELCGHATLAAAHVLWETSDLPSGERARFHTKSGVLTATQRGELIELEFPSTPPETVPAPPDVLDVIGAPPQYVGRSRFDYLVEVDGEDIVRRIAPDLVKLRAWPVRGVIVTSRARHADADFVSRFFAPSVGVDEDPVTGSAHCCLTPFWANRLGKPSLVARQLSARGGTLHVRLDGDRVHLGGRAVTIARGELVI